MPEEQNLQDQLKKNQDAIAGLQRDNARIQAQIKLLETHQAELQRATAGYPQAASDTLQKELSDDNTWINNKRKIAESVIKDLKDAVDNAIGDFQKALDEQGTKAKQATDAATKAASDNAAATQTLQDRQAAYTALQNQAKTLDAALKDLKALLDQAAKAEAQDDFLAMYFYLHEADAQAKDIAVPTPDDYRNQLVKIQSDIELANTDAMAKKAALDEKTTAAADAQKACDAAVAARRANLLDALRKVKAPALAATPAQHRSTGGHDAGADQPVADERRQRT